MRSLVLWNMVVLLVKRQWRTKTQRMSTLHFVVLEGRVADPLASFPVECGWKDIPTHGDIWRQQ